MRKFEKMIKENMQILISMIDGCFEKVSIICREIFINREYKLNIGTIYKGSVIESNMNFEKRCRKKDGFFWCDNSRLHMEVI